MPKKQKNKKQFKKNVTYKKIKARIGGIDYKNPSSLTKFLSSRFKILSRQKTGVSAKVQRKATIEIKKARFLGLLPFTERHQI
ncbi:30S ribosomal protein S18 [candidate division WWE3 bacterium CG09_land_8_20_14_0_10_39_24]|uniref:Small ribosomal subunit protein bS18 n=2 Tax=Katanobacteria TaxID=422282 RepID=A0A2G9XBK4_UNCKA|nr:MAG: 30S ribosomal protein S18 [bacterium CG09_39_24]PIP04365.1 MAG: 30S ribosomal protein S18 [candidate division WWE3 bacterium CG23_combo_of_CG06-09_8_20_14_all_40_14]PIS13116.1 MAG: 30S ribosomal protein S18 [candidate division WWE3 bacterium CG09_land_8_20_14_0_10_39_24]